MAGNTLVALTSATYDTSTPLFGTGALTGAYGNASTGAGGISGPTGLIATGWTMEFAAKGSAAPSATVALCGYNNTPSYSNAFYIGVTSAGFLTAVAWDNTANGSTGAHTYTGTTSIATGTWQRIAITVTSAAVYVFLGGNLVSTLNPLSGKNFSTLAPPEISLGNFYGTPNGPATGWEIDEFVVWPTTQYTGNYSPPANAYVGNEGMNALWHLDSTLADSSTTPATNFAPNNAGIVYCLPGLIWNVTSGQATTICGAAYFRTRFVGTGITLNFNVSGLTGTFPQIWVDIDGVSTQYTVASSITATIPSLNAAWPAHSLEVRVKGVSRNVDSWTGSSFVGFTGLTITGTGASLTAPPVQPKSVLCIGDSASEAWNTISTAPTSNGSDDVDCKDSTLGWAYISCRKLLGAEVGVFAFAGQGFAGTGQGGVPIFQTTLGHFYSGVSWNTSNPPSLIHLMMAANDIISYGQSASEITAFLVSYIGSLMTMFPNVPIAVSNYYYLNTSALPDSLNNTLTGAIQAAVAQVGSSLVSFQSMSPANTDATFLSSDGEHPLGVMNQTVLGPFKANLLRPLLQPTPRAYSFN